MLQICKPRCEYRENPLGIDELLPRFSWQLLSDRRSVIQTGCRIQVATDESFTSVIWDTGMADSNRSVHVPYNGPEIQPRTRYWYRIAARDNRGGESSWSEAAYWESGLLVHTNWQADWITPVTEPEDAVETDRDHAGADSPVNNTDIHADPCPMLRREFHAKGAVKSARIYATALGLYELYLNGKRVGDCLFTPGWTSYNNRLQYQTYDVTGLVTPGTNAAGAILGNGWYKGVIGWSGKNGFYGQRTALLFQLHLQYTDGSEEVICSDANWKFAAGPILMSEIYHGEIYDARLEQDGWNQPGYDAADWRCVQLYPHGKNHLVSQENEPVRIIEEIKPTCIFTTPVGETVIDFGQNMTGWVRFRAEGPAGSVITLQHAEVLDNTGNFYTENLRNAKQIISYTMKGEGTECFEPHFTFQGFRYVRVDGFMGKVLPEQFTGCVIHSALEQTGRFECSNELVNRLQHNILWGQKGNFLDIPTDCPQRDERLGWTGDAQMFIRTACFNMNTAPFFTKWLRDLYSEQSLEKGVPFVIPTVLDEKSYSSAAWGDAATICPWTVYLCYGDDRLLKQQYESMRLWVEYIRRQGENQYLWNTGFHFGDWLGLDSKPDSYFGATSTDLVATAFYAYSTEILAKTASILGKQEDSRNYRELHRTILVHFRNEFVTPNGRLAVETQTAHVLALMFGLVEEKDRKRTADTLARLLGENKNHLTTGFVGTPYLCHVLSKNGYTELAYELLQHTDYPSWLYQVTKGATTVWEHWDGIREDGSFWSRDMNSFNHYAYGAIGDWLYRVVAGLDADENYPGYNHILINPQAGGGLSYAKASLESMYGEIVSGWEKTSSGMKYKVKVPVNTTATVILPGAKVKNVREGGNILENAEGVSGIGQLNEGVRMEIGSGEYNFEF